jgi:polar amino acid transport system substrate-binding protein
MIRRMRRALLVGAIVGCLLGARPGAQGELRFGGDAEGGAPFMEADPNDTARVVGFEVDIAALLAAGLGRRSRFVQVGFSNLDPAVERGDFDIGLSGIEDNPGRRARLAVTVPYYEFREVLTVRRADGARFRSLSDLRGRRVATLGATQAAETLERARAEHGIEPVIYEDDVHPYTDLAVGRVDAVLLDAVLAERGVRRNPSLANQTTDMGAGHYVGILAARDAALRDRVDALLRDAMRDGRLQAIFMRWGMWNEDQPRLYARVRVGGGGDGALSAGALSSRADHAGAVVCVDGAGGRERNGDRRWPRLRHRPGADRSDGVGGAGTRHTAPAAAVRSVLRARVVRAAAGDGGGGARPRTELRRV